MQHRVKQLRNKQQHIFNRKENTKETSCKKSAEERDDTARS